MKRIALIAATLAGQFAYPAEPPAAKFAFDRSADLPAFLSFERLTATRERPLFSPTRRPPTKRPTQPQAPVPTSSPATTVVAPEEPPLDLMGTAIGEREHFVLLHSRVTDTVSRVREGDEQDGWRVDIVSLRSVTIERNGRIEKLKFADALKPLAGANIQLSGANSDYQSSQTPRLMAPRRTTLATPPP